MGSCGGKFVFISSGYHVNAHELKVIRLVHVARSERFQCVFNVSATSIDEVTVLYGISEMVITAWEDSLCGMTHGSIRKLSVMFGVVNIQCPLGVTTL
jgi:hypothetical protein